MDGIFNINKPRGISSGKVVYRIRRWTRIKKSGHAGTLDPAAQGVLLVCQGRATKLVETCMDLPKTYQASARLDITSPTFDAEKDTTPVQVDQIPDRPTLDALVADRFTGLIMQTPPAFSAVKINGQPAYKLARKGQTPDLKPRPVTIYDFKIERFDYPNLDFSVTCSRGTYVRSIIRDLALALRTGGVSDRPHTGRRRTVHPRKRTPTRPDRRLRPCRPHLDPRRFRRRPGRLPRPESDFRPVPKLAEE